jgi:SdrD B-like domain/WD40-like Beta Propeller Repeat
MKSEWVKSAFKSKINVILAVFVLAMFSIGASINKSPKFAYAASGDLYTTVSSSTSISGTPVYIVEYRATRNTSGSYAGVTASFTLPATLTGVSWTCTFTGTSACGSASGSAVTQAGNTIAPGEAVTYTITTTATAPSDSVVSATFTLASGDVDTIATNNSSTDGIKVISIIKTVADAVLTGQTSPSSCVRVYTKLRSAASYPTTFSPRNLTDVNIPASMGINRDYVTTCADATGNFTYTASALVGGCDIYDFKVVEVKQDVFTQFTDKLNNAVLSKLSYSSGAPYDTTAVTLVPTATTNDSVNTSLDGRFVAYSKNSKVEIVKTSSLSIIHTITMATPGAQAGETAFSADGSRLYVTTAGYSSGGGQNLEIYDTTTGLIIGSPIPLGGSQFAHIGIDDTDGVYFIGNYSQIQKRDIATNILLATFTVGGGYNLKIDTVNNRIFTQYPFANLFGLLTDTREYILDYAGTQLSSIVVPEPFGTFNSTALSPDGKYLAFSNGKVSTNPKIITYDVSNPASPVLVQSIASTLGTQSLVYSTDGKMLYTTVHAIPGSDAQGQAFSVAVNGSLTLVSTIAYVDPLRNSSHGVDSALVEGATAVSSLSNMCLGNQVWKDVNANGLQDDGGANLVNGVSLTLYMWTDANSDGIVAESELMIATKSDGSSQTTTTGTPAAGPFSGVVGHYQFDELAENKKYIVAVDNSNLIDAGVLTVLTSTAGVTGDTQVNDNDNGVDAVLGAKGVVSQPIMLSYATEPVSDGDASTSSDMSVDFGFISSTTPKVCIGDIVFFDANNNGVMDGTETPIANVKVNLYADANGDGTPDSAYGSPVATVNTDENGLYSFCGLDAGKYIVVVDKSNFSLSDNTKPLYRRLSSSDIATTNADNQTNSDDNGINPSGLDYSSLTYGIMSPTITLTVGGEPTTDGSDNNTDSTVDFGFIPASGLGDYVWYDTNKNGVQDAGETPVVGVRVELLDANGTAVLGASTQTTDANGFYHFDLYPGTYQVRFSSLPADFSFTGTDAGATGSKANTDGVTKSYVLGLAEQITVVDAGIIKAQGLTTTGATITRYSLLAALLVGAPILLKLKKAKNQEQN